MSMDRMGMSRGFGKVVFSSERWKSNPGVGRFKSRIAAYLNW